MVIYKYYLEQGNIIEANIISVLKIDIQNGDPVMWAIVDEKSPITQAYEVIVRGTGFSVNPSYMNNYIGTLYDGPFVWHYFLMPIERNSINDINDYVKDNSFCDDNNKNPNIPPKKFIVNEKEVEYQQKLMEILNNLRDEYEKTL